MSWIDALILLVAVLWVMLVVMGIWFQFYVDRAAEYEKETLSLLEKALLEARRPMTAYAILNVAPTATQEEIQRSYRELAMRFHPDRPGGDLEKFIAIRNAFKQLSKPARCPDCEGKGTIKVKRGAFVDTVQCPRCWPQGGT